MKNKAIILCSLLIVHCSLLSVPSLFAFGKKELAETEPDRLNNKWVLCITEFDYSMLPASRRMAGEVVARNLVDKMKSVSYRIRLSPEYAFYEGYAWQQSLNAAARAISQKQDERSQLLYRGDPGWRYQRNLQKLDEELAKLIEQFAEIEAEKPLINIEPIFELSEANINGQYPEIPKARTEYRFCRAQKADAFLSGQMRELHGRIILRLRLYILYAKSFVYEDDIIFSVEDIDNAVEEISVRLSTALSGSRPAVVAVRTNPSDAQILINQNYAGRGSVEAQKRPPGKITLAVAAKDFSPELVDVDLAGAELTDIEVSLNPLQYAIVNVSVPGKTDISVYHGALYVGEAPLTLRLPINQLEYIYVQTREGEMARAIISTPTIIDEEVFYSLNAKMPPEGEKRLNKARSRYYWAWAGTWTALLATWITSGIYTSQYNAITLQNARTDSYDPGFMDNAQRMYNINRGATVVLAVSGVYTIYRIVRYIYTANESSTSIKKREKDNK
jgi:hypothetical protein